MQQNRIPFIDYLRVVPPMVFILVLYPFLPLLWGGMDWNMSKDVSAFCRGISRR